MSDPTRDPQAQLPLTPPVYHILLALTDESRHGSALRKEVEARSGGRVMLSTGTLYAAIKRLLGGGLIEETDDRPSAEEDDQRRRYYVLTRFGRQVARAETHRMADLITAAQAKRLVPESLLGGGRGRAP